MLMSLISNSNRSDKLKFLCIGPDVLCTSRVIILLIVRLHIILYVFLLLIIMFMLIIILISFKSYRATDIIIIVITGTGAVINIGMKGLGKRLGKGSLDVGLLKLCNVQV